MRLAQLERLGEPSTADARQERPTAGDGRAAAAGRAGPYLRSSRAFALTAVITRFALRRVMCTPS